jgi:formate hydrogenlyase transcriptional activator
VPRFLLDYWRANYLATNGEPSLALLSVASANKGTLFLDEVGGIPLELQSKLLRVLQEREFERLGNPQTIRVDFRLAAATNRNLMEMVANGQFRRDLYYRLSVFPIDIPPLRERTEDIPMLVWHYVKMYARQMNKRVEKILPENMEALVNYCWPGNVRELQNVVERSMVVSSNGVLAISCPARPNPAHPSTGTEH